MSMYSMYIKVAASFFHEGKLEGHPFHLKALNIFVSLTAIMGLILLFKAVIKLPLT